jgi:hypothetical protein
MTIVADASVALRCCFQPHKSDLAEELLRSDRHLVAPGRWVKANVRRDQDCGEAEGTGRLATRLTAHL